MLTPASLVGSEVCHVRFDYQTTLALFHQEDNGTIRVDAHLVIYTPFVLRSRDGAIHNLDPETSRAALASVIDLFTGTITAVTVDGNEEAEYNDHGHLVAGPGRLTLDFADGAQLTVPPDDTYESWLLDDVREEDPPVRTLRRIRLGRQSRRTRKTHGCALPNRALLISSAAALRSGATVLPALRSALGGPLARARWLAPRPPPGTGTGCLARCDPHRIYVPEGLIARVSLWLAWLNCGQLRNARGTRKHRAFRARLLVRNHYSGLPARFGPGVRRLVQHRYAVEAGTEVSEQPREAPWSTAPPSSAARPCAWRCGSGP